MIPSTQHVLGFVASFEIAPSSPQEAELQLRAAAVGRSDAILLVGPRAPSLSRLIWRISGRLIGVSKVQPLANPVLERIRQAAMADELSRLAEARPVSRIVRQK